MQHKMNEDSKVSTRWYIRVLIITWLICVLLIQLLPPPLMTHVFINERTVQETTLLESLAVTTAKLLDQSKSVQAATCSGNADTVVSQNDVTNATQALSTSDSNAAELYDTGDQIVLDLTDTLSAGSVYTIRWRRDPMTSSNPSVTVEESSDGINFTAATGSPFSFSTTSYFDQSITTSTTTRYLRLTTQNTYNVDLDAVSYTNTDCTTLPPLTGTGVLTVTKQVDWNGNIPDPTKPFTLNITGPDNYNFVDTITAGQTKVYTDLVTGIYTVTESTPGAGWGTSYLTNGAISSTTSSVVVVTHNDPAEEPPFSIQFHQPNTDVQIAIANDRRSATVTGNVLDRTTLLPTGVTYSVNITVTGGPNGSSPVPFPSSVVQHPARIYDVADRGVFVSDIGLGLEFEGRINDQPSPGQYSIYRDSTHEMEVVLTLSNGHQFQDSKVTFQDIDAQFLGDNPSSGCLSGAEPNNYNCRYSYIDQVKILSGMGSNIYSLAAAAQQRITGDTITAYYPDVDGDLHPDSVESWDNLSSDYSRAVFMENPTVQDEMRFIYTDPGYGLDGDADGYHDFDSRNQFFRFIVDYFDIETDGVVEIHNTAPPPPNVLIGDRVWIEDDNDGDATTGNITPVIGATVTATASDGTTYTDVTDASGNYNISVPANSLYTVTVSTPVGTTPSGTLITTDSDPTTQNDLSHDGSGTVVTVGTEDNLTIDFGFYEPPPPPPCGTDPDDLGGTIWRDYNSNGIQDANELGFDGVTVTAYDNDGNGVTTTVNPDGTYTFSDIFATETHIRLEFSGLPDWMESGVHGANSGTTVQIHTAATCDADLAVQNPADYCQSNPNIATSCFTGGADSLTKRQENTEPIFVQWPYDTTGNTVDGSDHIMTGNTTANSMFGVAWDRTHEQLYASSFLKRQVALEHDPGTIYLIDEATGAATVWTTIPNTGPAIRTGYDNDNPATCNGLVSGTKTGSDLEPPCYYWDPDAFPHIARYSLGDIEVNSDDSKLYVTNLYDRKLYIVIINPDGTAGTATPIDTPTPAGCTTADLAPFATKYHDGALYLGLTCTARSTQMDSETAHWVYRLDDEATPTWTQVFSDTSGFGSAAFPNSLADIGSISCRTDIGGFEDGRCGTSENYYLLTDIEFIGYDMVLGLRNVKGDYIGRQSGNPDALADPQSYVGISEGFLRRTCTNDNQTWTLESSGSCPLASPLGGGFTGSTNPFFRPTLPGGHIHGSLGGLLQIPGFSEFASTHLNPTDSYEAGGVLFFDNSTGAKGRGHRLYQSPQLVSHLTWDPFSFGKANGLGDLEALCLPAPLEIGNYVWLDDDGDGIQDPCESAIPGVDVVLTASDGTTQTVTTDINGEYYFPVDPNSAYTLTIDMTQPELITYTLTVPNVDAGTTLTDGVDSDAVAAGNLAVIPLTTGNAGENDHTFDFGFVPEPPQVLIGDRVWIEDDNDGDATTGVTIPVTGTVVTAVASDGTVYTDTTDALGYYTITVPANAVYTVTVGTPSGTVVAVPTGGLVVADSDPNTDNDTSHDPAGTAVTVGTEDNFTIDFGFYNPPPPPVLIGNRVWLEDDNDGLATTGVITPVIGTVVTATASDGTVYTNTTDSMGYYTITVPANAVYTVTVGTPAGTVAAVPIGGLITTDSDPNNDNDTSHDPAGTVVTVGTENNLTIDFGFYPPPAPTFDLALVKTTNATNVDVGDPITFTIHVMNQGTADASNIEICDWIPSGFDFNAALSPTGWNTASPYPVYTIPTLAAGMSTTVDIVLDVNMTAGTATDDLVNIAEIRAAIDDTTSTTGVDEDSTLDAAPANPNNDAVIDRLNGSDVTIDEEVGDEDDHDIASVTLNLPTSITLEKVLNTLDPVKPGTPISFTIRITNTGGTVITMLPLTDVYNSAYLAFVSATPVSDDSTDDGTINWSDLTTTLGDLNPGDSMAVVVNFTTLLDTTLLPDSATINRAVVWNEEDEAPVRVFSPTSVELTLREVAYRDENVIVRWKTADESDVAGFHIYRQIVGNDDSEPIKLTPEMMIAEKSGSPSGASYSYEDENAEESVDYRYFVGIVDVNGFETQQALGNVLTQRTVDEWFVFLPITVK